MKKILIVKVVANDHEDSYSSYETIVPATNTWIEVSEEDFWLLRKHLDRSYRIIEDNTFRLQEFLEQAKEKERIAEEKKKAAEEKQKKSLAKRKANAIEKKRKLLESLKRELGE